MEFYEKLQALRKQKGLTQEELAQALYVSRTAISKWESNRGYPSIDSLKALSNYFAVSVDELLSGDAILTIAEEESQQGRKHVRSLVFGLLDCSTAMLLFLPFFAQRGNDVIQEVPLLALTGIAPYVKLPYLIVVFSTILWGILTLAFQNSRSNIWLRNQDKISLGLSTAAALLFMLSLQPYAAVFTFVFCAIKALILIKQP